VTMPKPDAPNPKDVWNTEKNGPKKGTHAWQTDDIRFDQEGGVYIANEQLARQLDSVFRAWGERLKIYRDKFPEEEASAGREDVIEIRRASTAKKSTDPPPADPDDTDAGYQVNMMCPCAPEPPPGG
jgi:hypothetical protein